MRRRDITGQRFGKLVAIKGVWNRQATWLCKCDCGNEKWIPLSSLSMGHTTSCGCLRSKGVEEDAKFGKLTVLQKVEKHPKFGQYWLCQCDCGGYAKVLTSALLQGASKSCGCYNREAKITHGDRMFHKYSKEIAIYQAMKDRCYNPNNKRYKDYGGRGIKVCDRWLESFENFLEDVGRCPNDKYSIDRIDNDGNYCPENTRWASIEEQANNRRNSNFKEFNGKVQTVTQWSRELGINKGTLECRLNKLGWSVEKSFTTPVKKYKKD